MRTSCRLAALAVAMLVLAVTPASASAARPPKTFFGIASWNIPSDRDYKVMNRAKIGTYRFPIFWSTVEGVPGERNWGPYDEEVRRAARGGVSVLPYLSNSPPHVEALSSVPPRSAGGRSAYARFAGDAVRRYGPNGSFWRENPDLPKRPVRRWQLWNEPNGTREDCRASARCPAKTTPANFGKLVIAASKAIRRSDRKAKIALAGIAESERGYSINKFLTGLYKVRRIKSAFDAVALHPYARDHRGVEKVLKAGRTAMNRRGDKRTPIWLTELSWATGGNKRQQTVATRSGQAQRLTNSFKLALKRRSKYRLEVIVWFTLQDDYPEGHQSDWTPHTGLFNVAGAPKPSWKAYLKFSRGKGAGARLDPAPRGGPPVGTPPEGGGGGSGGGSGGGGGEPGGSPGCDLPVCPLP